MSDLQRSLYRKAVDDRIARHGQLVLHLGERDSWLRLHFYDIPKEANVSGIEIDVIDQNPKLWGHIDYFEGNIPQKTRRRNSREAQSGSRFVVSGVLYDIEEMHVNHRGGVTIDLVSCNEMYPNFEQLLEVQEQALC